MRATPAPAIDPLRQLAESTETSALRDGFDAHNARLARFAGAGLAIFMAMTSLALLANGRYTKAAAAGAVTIASVLMFLVATGRGRTLASRTARFKSEWIIGLAVMQTAGFIALSYLRPQNVTLFATLGGMAIVFAWMAFARRVLVHTAIAIFAVAAIETTPAPLRHGRAEFYAPAFSVNAMALLVGGWLSRRARQRIVSEWKERQAQAIEQLRMRDELQFAREVQLSMLPEAPPQLPWLDVAARSIPATEVGGDYYDYFRVGDGLALVCGDVAGHGLASGIVLAALRSGFTLLRDSLSDPAAVLTRLHDLVEQTSRRRMLATTAVMVIDPAARRARIASAGHPPVMVRSNGSVRSIELFGPPLGVRLPVKIAETELPLNRGDVFVLHSDGVYETENSSGDLYGLDRLAAVIARSPASAASELLDVILEDVNTFRGGAPQGDDVTVVVAIVR